jgi:hypothetical protein
MHNSHRLDSWIALQSLRHRHLIYGHDIDNSVAASHDYFIKHELTDQEQRWAIGVSPRSYDYGADSRGDYWNY